MAVSIQCNTYYIINVNTNMIEMQYYIVMCIIINAMCVCLIQCININNTILIQCV